MSAEALSRALAELEDRWERHGATTRAGLAPGDTSDTIAARLADIGLVPSQEVDVWFRWQGGQAVEGTEISPTLITLSLDQAIEMREVSLDMAEEFKETIDPGLEPPEVWDPTWVPFAQFNGGDFGAQCFPLPTESSPVWRYEAESAPANNIADSITDLVVGWVRLIDENYLVWSADEGQWNRTRLLPPELRPFLL